jgi:hypothetical protein
MSLSQTKEVELANRAEMKNLKEPSDPFVSISSLYIQRASFTDSAVNGERPQNLEDSDMEDGK